MTLLARFLIVAACLLGVSASATAEEVKIPGSGLTLNGEMTMARGKTLADGVVILLHGTLMSNKVEMIVGLQKALAERGVNSLAVNLALAIDDRHGNYDCQLPHRHRQADAVDEIAAWVEWLKGQGARNITVAGHSRGGAQVALYAATNDDAAIARYILIAPAVFNAAESAQSYEASFKTKLAPILAQAETLVKDGKGDTMLADTAVLYCPATSVSAASFVSYYADDGKKDAPTLVAGVKKPTLVIAAGKDTIMRDVEKLVVPEPPRVRLVTIEGADHFFLDLFLDDLTDRIVDYLGK